MTIREQKIALYERINDIKLKLKQTDYIAIKYAEGEMSIAEYAPIRDQRKAWRSEINALEAEIADLRVTS